MKKSRIEGVLVIDKPEGPTSFDVVRAIRRATGIKKVGHTGTLDPMATGVLPVCLGKATKLVPYLQEGEKEYTGEMTLGITTDTDDITGQVISRDDKADSVSPEDVTTASAAFIGKIKQVPPIYSAVKLGGRPAYKLARKGEAVPVKPREVEIFQFEITSVNIPKIEFRAVVSKGTYIRSLVSDMGKKLGVGACLSSLRRTASGPFTLKDAVPLDALKEFDGENSIDDRIIGIDNALPFMQEINVDVDTARMVANGRPIPINADDGFSPGPVQVKEFSEKLLAIYEYKIAGEAETRCLTPLRVLAGD